MIVSNGPFRFAVVPLLVAGEPAYLQSGLNASLVHDSVERLRNSLLLMGPVVLLLCVAGGYWLAGRAFRPIGAGTPGLYEIQPTNFGFGLALCPGADEVSLLPPATNG